MDTTKQALLILGIGENVFKPVLNPIANALLRETPGGQGIYLAARMSPLMSSVLKAFKQALDNGEADALTVYAERKEVFAYNEAFTCAEECRDKLLADCFKRIGRRSPFWEYKKSTYAVLCPGVKPTNPRLGFLTKLAALDLHKNDMLRQLGYAYFRYKNLVENWFLRTQNQEAIKIFETELHIWHLQMAVYKIEALESASDDEMGGEDDFDPDPDFDSYYFDKKCPRITFLESVVDLEYSVEMVASQMRTNESYPFRYSSKDFRPVKSLIGPELKERMMNAYCLLLEQDRKRLQKFHEAREHRIAEAVRRYEPDKDITQSSNLAEAHKVIDDCNEDHVDMTFLRWEKIKSIFREAVHANETADLVVINELYGVSMDMSDYAAFVFLGAMRQLQSQGFSKTEAETEARKLIEVREAVMECLQAKSLFLLEVHKWFKAWLKKLMSPPPAVPRTVPLPNVFSMSIGLASKALRRCTGGARFWEEDIGLGALRTKPISGQKEEMSVIYRPDITDLFDEGESVVREALKEAWQTIDQLGPDEADWFDLILAKVLDGWQERDKNRPGKWVIIRVEDLRRARTKGNGNGFQNKQERDQHYAALQRLLSMQFVWETTSTPQEKPEGKVFDYFTFTEASWQSTPNGGREPTAFSVCPTWWFDVEMRSNKGYAARYFEAGLRLVFQIPLYKPIAKAVARFLIGGFWRERAADPRRSDAERYKIALKDLFDCAGIVVPEWAAKRTSQFAEDVRMQLEYLSTSDHKGRDVLISMPDLTIPAGIEERFSRFLDQEIELKHHPEVMAPLRNTISMLEEQGRFEAKRRQEIQIQAAALLLAEKTIASVAQENSDL